MTRIRADLKPGTVFRYVWPRRDGAPAVDTDWPFVVEAWDERCPLPRITDDLHTSTAKSVGRNAEFEVVVDWEAP